MRLVRFLFMVVLALSLLGVGASNANAQGPAPSLGQSKDVKEWGDAELKLLVNLVFEEKISVLHLRAILDQLNPAQSERMGDLVAVRAGIPSDQWRKFKADRLTNNNSVSSLSINPTWPGPTALWRQFIEKGAPAAGTRARQYWQSQWCDWPEPDMDWEFDFSMWYNQNPDSLRWDTTSPQVAFAFWFAYGNNLSGYAHQWNQVRLCLGESGVALAGGPAQVQATVFIHQ